METSVKKLEDVASQVRRDIIRMVSAVNSGHPGGSMSATDIMVALFFDVMEPAVSDFTIKSPGSDVFYLSNGHISPALYSVLARRGYFDIKELATFRHLGSRLQGHPTPVYGLPGVHIATGSLGQGISVALGHALAKRVDGDAGKVFVVMGDGELQEGQVWEAAGFASARKIDNVIAVVDYNGQQIDGKTDEVSPLGDLRAKFEAFGWRVLEVAGHDMEQVVKTLAYAKNTASGKGKPVMILAKTVMGKGVDFMEDTNEYHGKAPSAEQALVALSQLRETLGDY
ncbi:MAG: transketolase [Mucinivorans sp.]